MRSSIWMLLLLVKLVADVVYVELVSPLYAYAGYIVDFNAWKYLASVLLTFALGLSIRKSPRQPTEFLYAVLVIFVALPVLSIWALTDRSSIYVLQLVISFLVIRLVARTPFKLTNYPANGIAWFWITVALISAVFISVYVARGGLGYLNFSLAKTYAMRDRFEEAVFSGHFVYIVRWFSKMAIIAAIAMALQFRNRTFLLLFLLLGLSSFFLTTAREQLVYPFIPLGLYFIDRYRLSPTVWMGRGVLFAILAGATVYVWFDEAAILGFFVLRAFFAIGDTNFLYYEFFSDKPFTFFSQSFMSSWIEYPYDKPIPSIIGEGRYGTQSSFSNTGMFASGYMHMGFAGMLIYSVIVGLIFRLMDSFYRLGAPSYLVQSLGFVMVYQLVNSDLLTGLLTHGIGFGLLLLYFSSAARQRAEKRGYINDHG